ncbi:MAG: 1,4-alpha-glucan branching protein GlgB [Candidatus Melainabacteria bacterium]|nr:1,4-alpha-glucan branching protein GlgB [Candidatus Melainabacteria bacterium]
MNLQDPPSTTSPVLSDYDLYLLAEGQHFHLYDKLGAHLTTQNGQTGTYFAVWAPNAEGISVIGDFNQWRADRHPMHRVRESGYWEAFLPEVGAGDIYKYWVRGRHGHFQSEKADPVGFASELRPRTASQVWDLNRYTWQDQTWMEERPQRQSLQAPVSIYEVHLGSWMRVPEAGNRWLSYRELADKLTRYVKEMGYTHVELLPIAEHPFDGSWGYQTVGYFAPSSRFGRPDDLMYLIDTLHQNNIGVILDWVPAHFPRDGHGLRYFDGTHLYEHADPRLREHKDWGTDIFNYGRWEVRNFLIANALFWLDKYHIDGLRVDAVASMLYLDYARQEGEWLPNAYGGRENLDAIQFIRQLNETVYREHPDVMMLAEESTAWPQVSRPTYLGGLGFGYKWDMGWMNDTLEYMKKDPLYRSYHQDELTFRGMYQYSENFVMPLSHDEVVHGKGSMIGKMPGDPWQQFANLRLLYGYQYTLPGKKLLFMGNDIAQWVEWHHDRSLDWHLLEYDTHRGVQAWVKALNHLYRSEPALHLHDVTPGGFEWVDCKDFHNSVLSWLRHGDRPEDDLLVIANFTPMTHFGYRFGVPSPGSWRTLLNSDSLAYGGSDQLNPERVTSEEIPWHNRAHSIELTVPPLGLMILKREG